MTSKETEKHKFSRGKCIGKGSFGVVYEGQHNHTGQKVALKQCVIVNNTQGTVAMKEIKNIGHVTPHKHIIHMLDFHYHDNSIWIVMEYCDKGDLTDYMKKYAPNLDKQMKIMHQCASAVDHIHSMKVPVVHRDIKPANVLFKTEGRSVVAKLTDFGLSKIIDHVDSASKARMGTVVGTPAFMAPEMFARKKYDKTVDTFSLAMVFLAMINFKATDEDLFPVSASFLQSGSESLVFVGQEMHEANLSKSKPPVVVNVVPMDSAKLKSIKKLIIAMSNPDPSKRMSIKDSLKEIETSAGESSKGFAGKVTASHIFTSNLDLTMTRRPPDLSVSDCAPTHRSSGYGGSETDTVKPSDSSGREGKEPSGSEGKKEPEREVTAEEEPDLGYALMRQIVEDYHRKKREELKEQKAKQEAAQFAAALPLFMLLKLMESDSENATKLEIGDKVIVDEDQKKAEQLQINYGGWSKKMAKYLGEEGTVKEIKGGRIIVQFSDGVNFKWNAHLLHKVDEKHKAKAGGLKDSKFKMHDVVKIKVSAEEFKRIQKSGNAGWRDKMANVVGFLGGVRQVHNDGDVKVEFITGDVWWISPDALEVVDMSGLEIEAGDIVVIIDDRKKVQELQKGHGEWVPSMEKCLGRSGCVRKVSSNNRAIVEIADTKYIWNIKCLKLMGKVDDILNAMIMKHLFLE